MVEAHRKIRVIYDDHCATCNVAKSMGEKMDSHENLDFVGMHTDEGKKIIAERELDMEKSAYAIKEDGTVYSRAHMVHTVLKESGLVGRMLGGLLYLLPSRIADGLYDFASKHRSHKH